MSAQTLFVHSTDVSEPQGLTKDEKNERADSRSSTELLGIQGNLPKKICRIFP